MGGGRWAQGREVKGKRQRGGARCAVKSVFECFI